VVESGTFAVLVNGHKVTEVGQGGGFGELALLYGQPRAATVTAITDAVVWGVDRLTFRRIVMASTFKKRKEHDTFLKVHTHTHTQTGTQRERDIERRTYKHTQACTRTPSHTHTHTHTHAHTECTRRPALSLSLSFSFSLSLSRWVGCAKC
jgi:CRP-like cAMP-binding protein